MESVDLNKVITSPAVITAIIIGASVLILVYIIKLFNAEQKVPHKPKNENKNVPQCEKKKDTVSSGKSKKKVNENKWTGRSEKQAFTHPWLLTSLKGHTGQILDMDFSSNGKYLASCGDEDPDPGGELLTEGSSGSECNKENSRPASSEPSPRTKGLSRRQRKNRRREDASPPDNTSKKKPKPKKLEQTNTTTKKQVMEQPLKQCLKLNLNERCFAGLLHNYVMSMEQMLAMGYPVENGFQNGLVLIYKNNRVPSNNQFKQISPNLTKFDVNAREFVPNNTPWLKCKYPNDWNANDSGQGSGSSSDSGENLEDSEETSSSSSEQDLLVCRTNSERAIFEGVSVERLCVRCGNGFFTANNEYLTQERCTYHWGKLHTVYSPGDKRHGQLEYVCCRGKSGSRGCSVGKLHVWNGVVNGINGPYEGYVRTKPRRYAPPDGSYGVYALDCEMCYTVAGLELTKVTVVGMDGRLVYDSFVKPDNEIVDYNTRFSGIKAKDLNTKGATKSLKEVQNDLMGFINADTILIGHGLENDLRALKILHNSVVDTAVTFPHYNGLPYRRSLKSLTSSFLKRDIQCGVSGHNSYEDAAACMELMLWRVRKDFRSFLELYT